MAAEVFTKGPYCIIRPKVDTVHFPSYAYRKLNEGQLPGLNQICDSLLTVNPIVITVKIINMFGMNI